MPFNPVVRLQIPSPALPSKKLIHKQVLSLLTSTLWISTLYSRCSSPESAAIPVGYHWREPPTDDAKSTSSVAFDDARSTHH